MLQWFSETVVSYNLSRKIRMIRNLIALLAALSLLTTIPACTSKDSKSEDEIIAEEGTPDELSTLSAEGGDEALEGEQKTDTTANPDATVADSASEDQLTIDSFNEGTTSTEPSTTESAPPTTTDVAASEPTTNSTELTPSTTVEAPAPTPEPVPDMAASGVTDMDQQKPAPKALQKVAETPWKMGSKWVNGIYFARPGDTLQSISQTIYGDDRSKELQKINPTYKSRDVKPGDKIYYASTVRPDDSEKILTYYEEKNIPAKTYVAKSGDNIRKISKELLGYPEAWKEVWASNTVESKQEIPEGTELRYWDSAALASTGAPSQDMAAATNPEPMPPQEPMPPADSTMPPPPADPSMANNELPPPPPSELPPPPDMAASDLPPPPPPADIPPPPPPPPPPMDSAPQAAAQTDEGGSATAEQDETLAIGAVAAAVLGGLALIIVRRKRRQKELDQSLGETHVG